MTVIDNEVKLASFIDAVFDDDHVVCCKVGEDFEGVTTALCGAKVILEEGEFEEVINTTCGECERLVSTGYCPLGNDCSE